MPTDHRFVLAPKLSGRLRPTVLPWRLIVSIFGASLLAVAPLQAQTIQPQAAPTSLADATPHNYHIPAGPLGAALSSFASQSGLLLSFDPALTRGLNAPALVGRYTLRDGLRRLLVGSQLQLVVHPDGSYGLAVTSGAGATSVSLPSVLVLGSTDSQQVPYSAPRSSVYLSGQDISRFGRISPADLLAGVPGVQVGDSRNGGALDINIRGIQGQSRVAVRIDSSEQALNVYRGYAGTQQRSYIDPDLLSSVTINKGPTLNSGSIGGTVEASTIGVKDILVDGKKFGVRLEGTTWNNGVAAPYRDPNDRNGRHALTAAPHDKRAGLFGSQASGSVALAYSNDMLDLVAAYSQRHQGNYFSGRKGRDAYRVRRPSGWEESSVGKFYKEGEEVLNSSSDTESMLLKSRLRLKPGHTLDLGYRRFDARIGEIMPSDIYRYGSAGVWQYPLGRTTIDAYTARYNYKPSANPWLDVTANLWLTDAQTSQLTSVSAPKSQSYRTDRHWTRQVNRRIGGDIGNISRFQTSAGDFKLHLGGAFQLEKIAPQDGVVTTQHDVNANRMLRDAARQEYSLNGKLEYLPNERLTLWGGARYSFYSMQDNNVHANARHKDQEVKFISVYLKPTDDVHYMMWLPDQNGNYTNATDPRLHNGIVFENENYPLEGVPFNDYGATWTYDRYDPKQISMVTGYDYSERLRSSASGLAPALGVKFELLPDTFVYTSYTQALRMPSLFETSQGTLLAMPGVDLKPEHSHSWELGASTQRKNLLVTGDSAALKLVYFDNKIKNYIMRYYDPSPQLLGLMNFTNADSYQTSGLELQSNYDAGLVFADLSATYYFKTETCDAAFAARIRSGAINEPKLKDTPDCTPASFKGSYVNTQNPPKLSLNLITGLRFLNETLTLGVRTTYMSGPTDKVDKIWQQSRTTKQILYQPVTLFDLFLNYQLRKHITLNASLQNLTDRYYLDPLAQSFMPAPGRTLRFGVQAKF